MTEKFIANILNHFLINITLDLRLKNCDSLSKPFENLESLKENLSIKH